MQAPSSAEVRGWAPPLFDWARYGYAAPQSGTDPLDFVVTGAVADVFNVTGRSLDSVTTDTDISTAQRAIALLCMTAARGGGADALEVADAPWIKSFTAGSYSETRLTPQEAAASPLQGRMAPPYPEPLWGLLWALMSDEKRAEWLAKLAGTATPIGGAFEAFGDEGLYTPHAWENW